jgi:hypothetical protein
MEDNTKNESRTMTQKVKIVFSTMNRAASSKYFLIPVFGLDFAIRGGTKQLIPLLASIGISTYYPLLVELSFALLAGVGIYYAYKAVMDYIMSPIFNVLGQWFSCHIYQPCCNFARNIFSNTTDTELELSSPNQSQSNDIKKNLDFENSPAVFLPSGSLDVASDKIEQTNCFVFTKGTTKSQKKNIIA